MHCIYPSYSSKYKNLIIKNLIKKVSEKLELYYGTAVFCSESFNDYEDDYVDDHDIYRFNCNMNKLDSNFTFYNK